MLVLILGLILFLGVHSVKIVAPAFRDRFIAQRGENTWKGLYTVISLAGFVLIIWGFSIARYEAPILYTPPFWFTHVTLLLMLVSFILLVASSVPPSRIKVAVKHPMLLAVKLWSVGHLMANGDLASVILFGSFLVWAIFDRISVSRREAAGLMEPIGPGSVRNDVLAVVIGVVAYILFVWKLHEWLFGVPPVVI
ncbi:MAG: NnrU family protein [Alphaproteobacteria bacterium]|nr:NnrU family protein [Alphaproteobacteria bacterium]